MQYAEFLNAVAATDTNGLYNSFMGADPRGVSSGIDHVSYSTNGSDQEFVGGHAGRGCAIFS